MANKFRKAVKSPISDENIKKFADENLEQLFLYKSFVLQELATLKQVLLKDESDSGSQSTAEEQSFLKALYTVSEKAIKLPKLNDDEDETKDVAFQAMLYFL
ncbi:hypothetical protein RMATCC62417_17139 [Rhizopus microsporus]|nr:hypothetical protein RMATCC62417_17139 [Rhizopus microsporus]